MRLYHTSNIEIREPDIYRGRKNADFGQGFYLTPDKDFTYRWAGNESIVNEFEFDDRDLVIHTFSRNEDWFNYIFNNRRAKDTISADVIIGPIANDTIFDTFGIISSGFIKPADALKLLMVGPVYTQVVVKTVDALKHLTWICSQKISRIGPDLTKEEQESYQMAFNEVIDEIVE